MPRLHLTSTFLLLNLVCFAFYRTLQLLIIKRYAINDFTLLKPAATLLFFKRNNQSTNWGEAATFKKQAKTLNKKALAAFNKKENSIH